jgi:hypothetical protein
MNIKLIIFFTCSFPLISAAFDEKCVGPLSSKAMYKIAVPFADGKYDYSYEKTTSKGKFTCFVKVKDSDDAIDFVASRPTKDAFEWLKRYVKK